MVVVGLMVARRKDSHGEGDLLLSSLSGEGEESLLRLRAYSRLGTGEALQSLLRFDL